jgi:hypothetical protein
MRTALMVDNLQPQKLLKGSDRRVFPVLQYRAIHPTHGIRYQTGLDRPATHYLRLYFRVQHIPGVLDRTPPSAKSLGLVPPTSAFCDSEVVALVRQPARAAAKAPETSLPIV